MGTCFIIQPFDGGVYDKRYRDVFAPAIKGAGLEPYRVDWDPKVEIPINDIEKEIRNSVACLAEISTDNPNVWFELGYAIASGKSVVLVCSKERKTKFPFDVQHRNIIQYSTESSSDFDNLGTSIRSKLSAILERKEEIGQLADMPLVARVEGLSPHEMAALITVAQNIDDPKDYVSSYIVRRDMENSGFTRIAVTLAMNGLSKYGMVESFVAENDDGEPFWAYRPSEIGMDWLMSNQDKLVLIKQEHATINRDDDLPF